MQFSVEDLEAIRRSDPKLFRSLVERLADQQISEAPSPFLEDMFPAQRAFFLDPSKRKAALCSRRAGKTFGVACWLYEGGRDCPKGLSVYICLSRNNARLILWATLIAINDRYKLNLWFRTMDNQLIVQLPNGHKIWLAGCKDSAEIDKFRGVKIRRAAIDEAASFGEYLRELVFDVLDPALLDYDGEMCLIGTPGLIPAGLFFEITTGQGYGNDAAGKWSTHSWTVLDNPHIPHAESWLANKRKENGWGENHPRYLREWLGQWVNDDGARCYPCDAARNYFYTLPVEAESKWIYALGVDVGYEDSTAFVVGAYRRGLPNIYIIRAEKHEHLIPSSVAARIQVFQERYGISHVVLDSGGIGKAYAEEASQRYGIYIEAAEKTKKRAFMELMKGELLSGTIRVQPRDCECLINEWAALVWDEKHEKPDPRFEDHASDAALYLWRALVPYYRPQIIEDPLTEEQVGQRQMQEARRQALLQVKATLKRRMKSGQVFRDIAAGRGGHSSWGR